MASYRIIDVSDQHSFLVVRVEHYDDAGDWLFTENYCFPGREGLRQKRMVNAAGKLLMDNDEIAPSDPDDLDDEEQPRQYLPAGREWKLHPAPHMDESSITDAIKAEHRWRVAGRIGYGVVDDVSETLLGASTRDEQGCSVLIAKFSSLKDSTGEI